jgi:hypothetical protein
VALGDGAVLLSLFGLARVNAQQQSKFAKNFPTTVRDLYCIATKKTVSSLTLPRFMSLAPKLMRHYDWVYRDWGNRHPVGLQSAKKKAPSKTRLLFKSQIAEIPF